MTDHLFTFICEFEGGTYASQVQALNAHHALMEWGKSLRHSRPMGDRAEIIADAAFDEDEPPTPLDGLDNVWCWTTEIDGRLLLANIVRTLGRSNVHP
ncbi:hypothetical protein [Sphingomonas crocodyli]|uniref:Uncharacterized protein n=1 Tax=Sphingomonas crocodyli TaxID=1979270 RepID=A0A437M6M9_9SPHN|nr:hypothetical protein [Sphingomonas crocodyli]RVT93370.1 hypothetical protein EOD43_05685 [Sphingomonas crocodyli]